MATSVPVALANWLTEEARHRGVSVSKLVAEALELYRENVGGQREKTVAHPQDNGPESELETRMRLVREDAEWLEANFPIPPEKEAIYRDGWGNFAEMDHGNPPKEPPEDRGEA